MKTLNRSTVTRFATTRAAKVLGTVNGLGARFNGFEAMRPATALPPGATPSRGYPGIDPSQHQPGRDCQSPRMERMRLSPVVTWRLAEAAKPANPN